DLKHVFRAREYRDAAPRRNKTRQRHLNGIAVGGDRIERKLALFVRQRASDQLLVAVEQQDAGSHLHDASRVTHFAENLSRGKEGIATSHQRGEAHEARDNYESASGLLPAHTRALFAAGCRNPAYCYVPNYTTCRWVWGPPAYKTENVAVGVNT